MAPRLLKRPSLKTELDDPDWREIVWGDAVSQAEKNTGISNLPAVCPWTLDQALKADWLPT